MQMSHAKLEITKAKNQEHVCNVLEMHLMMTSRSLLNMAYFSCLWFSSILFHMTTGSWNKSQKYEKFEKYLPYFTQHRAITSANFDLNEINSHNEIYQLSK